MRNEAAPFWLASIRTNFAVTKSIRSLMLWYLCTSSRAHLYVVVVVGLAGLAGRTWPDGLGRDDLTNEQSDCVSALIGRISVFERSVVVRGLGFFVDRDLISCLPFPPRARCAFGGANFDSPASGLVVGDSRRAMAVRTRFSPRFLNCWNF